MIGLYGGSFDPVHDGHIAVSLEALKRLGLNEIWWLFTPQNPLKHHKAANLMERIEAARQRLAHPRVRFSGIEAALGTRYTVDTLRALRRRFPRTRFIWILGADSFAELHHWRRWQTIGQMVPIAVFDRPGYKYQALASPAAHFWQNARRPQERAKRLAASPPPAWTYLKFPASPLSSSVLRQKNYGKQVTVD